MKKIILTIVLVFSLSLFSQENKQKIQLHLNNNLTKFGLTNKDISDWIVDSEVSSEATNSTIYYIVQRFQGIEIFNAQSNVSVKDGVVVTVGNRFRKNIAQKVNATTPVLTVIDAIKSAYSRLDIKEVASFSISETITNKSFRLSDGLQEQSISAKLVYQPTQDGKLKLAWSFQFYSPDGKYLWSIRIDALNGGILEKNDLVVSCNFGKPKQHYPSNYPFNFKSNDEVNNNVANKVIAPTACAYKVIPFNYESPSHSPFQLITNPYNTTASPNGWHNSNSLSGQLPSLKFTYTKGNNVQVQEDANGNNGSGISPDGGAALNFDFSYGGPTLQPSDYTSAASTNLFYMINIMHDVWYQYGFNEASGNFQKNNYNKGGLVTATGDYVMADSQDGYSQTSATLNNANFYTPNDGTSPKVQMYMWTMGAPPTDYVTVNSPVAIAGPRVATTNVFEGTDRTVVPAAPNGIAADLVLYKNKPTPPEYNSACQAPTNAAELIGKIALIKRGGCFFNLKVKNAQSAGAVGVIVMDSIPNNPSRLSMSSTGLLGITIPAVFVTKEIGDAFITEMSKGPVNVKLETPAGLYLYADGDFDNGIIAHEFTHGISNRLTGGPNVSTCLTSPEQMGEGWSDWAALIMQLKAGDKGEDSRGIGTYAVNEAITGGGIRSHPYSTDMAINPLTFVDTNGKTYIYTDPDTLVETEFIEPHDTGEVWAATLWDLTWAYIGKYGFNSDIYTGTGGNNKVMRLVLDAMKLQPCNPSYIEARDAVIAADQITTGGQDYCMIWKVFARRGLGINASSGDNSGNRANIAAIKDQVQDFTEPAAGANCVLSVNKFNNNNFIRIFPNPAPKGIVTIHVDQAVDSVAIQVVDLDGRLVFNSTKEDYTLDPSRDESINLSHLQKGIYIIKISGDSLNYSEKIIIK